MFIHKSNISIVGLHCSSKQVVITQSYCLLIQELTIEMFQDDDEDLPGSREHLVKAPPLTSSTPVRDSTYSGADDDELLAEAIGEERKGGFGYDSETSLI